MLRKALVSSEEVDLGIQALHQKRHETVLVEEVVDVLAVEVVVHGDVVSQGTDVLRNVEDADVLLVTVNDKLLAIPLPYLCCLLFKDAFLLIV